MWDKVKTMLPSTLGGPTPPGGAPPTMTTARAWLIHFRKFIIGLIVIAVILIILCVWWPRMWYLTFHPFNPFIFVVIGVIIYGVWLANPPDKRPGTETGWGLIGLGIFLWILLMTKAFEAEPKIVTPTKNDRVIQQNAFNGNLPTENIIFNEKLTREIIALDQEYYEDTVFIPYGYKARILHGADLLVKLEKRKNLWPLPVSEKTIRAEGDHKYMMFYRTGTVDCPVTVKFYRPELQIYN